MKRVPTSSSVIAAVLAVALSLTAAPAAFAAGGGGGGISSAPTESRPKSPEQQAEAAYKKGLKHKNRAWKAQEKAVAATSDKKRAKQEKKAAREYAKAQAQFAAVLQTLPEHYKAANELGYVLRKQGDYRRAVGAYNYALKLHPDFYEAIEYRGEAFVALGLYDEAREAYMRLFRNKPELAEQLMTAMTSWADQQTDAGAKKRNFLEWIEQRQSVSALGGVSESNSSGW